VNIGIVCGTRPEAIKQIPLYLHFKKELKHSVKLISSGQHKEMLSNVFSIFNVKPDFDFEVMKKNQNLNELASKVILASHNLFQSNQFSHVIVQGDTTTAAMIALSAFQSNIKVLHNEAGLRSHDIYNPFPEEANRKIISSIADQHFTPTNLSFQNLLKENITKEKIHVVGNTGIDSLLWILKNKKPSPYVSELLNESKKVILLTAHRRESTTENFERCFHDIDLFLKKNSNYRVLFPAHPNKRTSTASDKYFAGNPNVNETKPFSYTDLCHILKATDFVITDSGGIQEEAVTLGKPTVVFRETTERSEGIDAGLAKLAKPSEINSLEKAFKWAANYTKNTENTLPFGDGNSSKRIFDIFKKNV